MAKIITLKIDHRTGSATILDVEGAGTACGELTAALEAALGRSDESTRAHTDNYVKPVDTFEEVTNRGT